MTTRIREWSESATGNNATVAGINFAEGQLPSTVNNSARELMAQVRAWYYPDEAGWTDWGATASMNSQTVVKLAGDQTAMAAQGRRVRLRGGSATRYATVLSASFTSETAITLQDADGSLSASMSIIGLGSHPRMTPRRVDKLDVSGTASVGGNLVVGGSARVDGSVTMSGTVTIKTGLHVSGNATAASILVTGASGNGMAIFFSSVGMGRLGTTTNSYSVSVAGFLPIATGGGHGALFVDETNTGPSRVVLNGNGPYPIFTPTNASLTASAMVAGRLYQFWFQGGVMYLLNPTFE
jgi:hypothetical protein